MLLRRVSPTTRRTLRYLKRHRRASSHSIDLAILDSEHWGLAMIRAVITRSTLYGYRNLTVCICGVGFINLIIRRR